MLLLAVLVLLLLLLLLLLAFLDLASLAAVVVPTAALSVVDVALLLLLSPRRRWRRRWFCPRLVFEVVPSLAVADGGGGGGEARRTEWAGEVVELGVVVGREVWRVAVTCGLGMGAAEGREGDVVEGLGMDMVVEGRGRAAAVEGREGDVVVGAREGDVAGERASGAAGVEGKEPGEARGTGRGAALPRSPRLPSVVSSASSRLGGALGRGLDAASTGSGGDEGETGRTSMLGGALGAYPPTSTSRLKGGEGARDSDEGSRRPLEPERRCRDRRCRLSAPTAPAWPPSGWLSLTPLLEGKRKRVIQHNSKTIK